MFQKILDFPRNVKYGVQNLVKWFPVIWTDRWWDLYFIYPILHKKLSMVEKATRKYGHHVHAERDADKIKVCVLLLKRIMDDGYFKNAFKRHNEKWGDSNVSFEDSFIKITYEKAKTEEDKKEERKDFKRAVEHEELLNQQDINYLFKMMSKHLRTWWD
jgi:hypothetical protein